MPEAPIPQDDIRRQVSRIIASSKFDRSDLLVRFLRFISESALRGDAESLKEWVIGVQAYGRGDNFDPRVDSIVRTEARRLRRKLNEYYESEGREDPIIVELPTGSYEPSFRLRAPEADGKGRPQEPDKGPPEPIGADRPHEQALREAEAYSLLASMWALHRRWRLLALLCYLSAVVLTSAAWFIYVRYFAAPHDHIRRLALLPLKCSPNTNDCQVLATAFTHDLRSRLDSAGLANIIEPDASSLLESESLSPSELGSRLKADHVFSGTLEKSDHSWFLTARLIRVPDQTVVWTGRFEGSWANMPIDELRILKDILAYIDANSKTASSKRAEALRQTNAAEEELFARAEYALGNFNASGDKAYSDYAEQKLNQIVTLDPNFNDARILLARSYYERIWGTPDRTTLLEQSRSLLETAVKQEPKRADAQALLAGVTWQLGQKERAMQLARQALQLGPLDATAHAEMGRLYLGAGFFESAVVRNTQALSLDPMNSTVLGFQILCSFWLGRQNETADALRTFQQLHPGPLSDLFSADQQLRTGNFEEAGRLITTGRDRTVASNRVPFDIAAGLHAALTGNRTEARRVFEQYKNSPPEFFDHMIGLAAQLGEAGTASKLIRENPNYNNYRYLVTERWLTPLRGQPEFAALLFENYGAWRHDLSLYRTSLPAPPPSVPTPEQFLAGH